MDNEEVLTWDGENFNELQQALGKRPGDKAVDPYYIRRGIGNKVYFWDDYAKKWRLVSPGDVFGIRTDGTVIHDKRVKA